MNRQDKIFAIWSMNGAFYDAIMASCPTWLTYSDSAEFDQAFDDWLYSQIGL